MYRKCLLSFIEEDVGLYACIASARFFLMFFEFVINLGENEQPGSAGFQGVLSPEGEGLHHQSGRFKIPTGLAVCYARERAC